MKVSPHPIGSIKSPFGAAASDQLVSVAPMMDWTDRHCRYFHRLLAPKAGLFTEMVTTGAVIHGDCERLLGFDPAEHPVAVQLGGSDPEQLAKAAKIGAAWGYDEINLNVGCPSDRVQKGRFGACLMKEPELVSACVAAMEAVVSVPVSVKCRIGVDEMDSDQAFIDFIGQVTQGGRGSVIVHARKAWLSGLSPKENREKPPIDAERVAKMAAFFPELRVIFNGGITTVSEALSCLERFDGVMLARAAYQTPWILTELSAELGQPIPPSRRYVVEQMVTYIRAHVDNGGRVQHVARHMLGLFHGQPGARAWRQRLSQTMHRPDAKPQLLLDACPEPACFNPALEGLDWPGGGLMDGGFS